MNILKKKSGFTLIEIIIVIVIIGVLASLALPRLSNQIIVAQATEAISNLGKYMKAIDQCYQIQEAFTACDEMDEVRDFSYSTNFSYYITAAAPSVSARVARNNGNNITAADTFTFTINTATGAITKTVATSGAYRGLKLR